MSSSNLKTANKIQYAQIICHVISIVGVLSTVMYSYINGKDIFELFSFLLPTWLGTWIISLLLIKIPSIINLNKYLFTVGGLFIYLMPISLSAEALDIRRDFSTSENGTLFLFLTGLFIMLIEFAIVTYKLYKTSGYKSPPSENVQITAKEENPSGILGQGNTTIDIVISSINSRAFSSQKMILTSLIIMVLIVILGGSASMGTTVLDEMKKVRELEVERNKLITLSDAFIKDYREKYYYADSQHVTQLNYINSFIKDNYRDEKTYQEVLNKLQKQSQNFTTSWQDIVLRITIAALTLFLVQVFFHIYKYNQQNASHLWAKSEALELYKDASENNIQSMRDAVLSKVDNNPTFGKSPPSPVDQAIELLNKAKNSP